MKIKPVIAIILEAPASFVIAIRDTVFCPGGILHKRLELENSVFMKP